MWSFVICHGLYASLCDILIPNLQSCGMQIMYLKRELARLSSDPAGQKAL